jgi:hypothetical protein
MPPSTASAPITLPALFWAADEASLRAQRLHLRLLRADLAGLVIGAILTSFTVAPAGIARALAVLGATMLTGSLVLTVILMARRGEHRWYGARFVAESVKTMSWRYMMAAEPYPSSLPEADADGRFLHDLADILAQTGPLGIHIGGAGATDGQITDGMRELRRMTLDERRAAYRTFRIADQRSWYAGRSRANDASAQKMLALVIATQLGAVLCAVLLVAVPSLAFNAAGVLSAAAAACLAWLQARRHQELSQSYGVAAHELGLIAEHERHVAGETRFAEFVTDAESAISREHTLWIARRDVPGVHAYR